MFPADYEHMLADSNHGGVGTGLQVSFPPNFPSFGILCQYVDLSIVMGPNAFQSSYLQNFYLRQPKSSLKFFWEKEMAGGEAAIARIVSIVADLGEKRHFNFMLKMD